jgi:hypothetical protein
LITLFYASGPDLSHHAPWSARQSAAFDGKFRKQRLCRGLLLVGPVETSDRGCLSQTIMERELLYEE